jgi:hypothetical protein
MCPDAPSRSPAARDVALEEADRLAGSILQEIEWDNGAKSFYFHEQSGERARLADGELWPES